MPRKKVHLLPRRQVNFRIDLETYCNLERLARKSKTSLTETVTNLINKSFGGRKAG